MSKLRIFVNSMRYRKPICSRKISLEILMAIMFLFCDDDCAMNYFQLPVSPSLVSEIFHAKFTDPEEFFVYILRYICTHVHTYFAHRYRSFVASACVYRAASSFDFSQSGRRDPLYYSRS